MKSTIKEWLFLGCIIAAIGFVIYTASSLSGSPEVAKWLAKPFSDATVKDVLGTGGILVVSHALLSR
jgi:hypothetical protein